MSIFAMTGSQTDRAAAERSASFISGKTPPIRLSLSGEELVVTGRFDHWAPVALDGSSDEGAAQLFFDVTGMAGGPRDTEEELFSYTAHDVQRIGALAFAAKG